MMGRSKSTNRDLNFVQKFCRTCLSSETNMNSIDEKFKVIEDLTGLKVSEQRHDSLDWLCKTCEDTLKKFKNFREICFIVDKVLQKYLSTNKVSRKVNSEYIKNEREKLPKFEDFHAEEADDKTNPLLIIETKPETLSANNFISSKVADKVKIEQQNFIKLEFSESNVNTDDIYDDNCGILEENDPYSDIDEIQKKFDNTYKIEEIDDKVLSKIKNEIEVVNGNISESNDFFYHIDLKQKEAKHKRKKNKNKNKVKEKKLETSFKVEEHIKKEPKGNRLLRKKARIVIDSMEASEVVLTTEEQLREREDLANEESYLKSTFKCEMCILAFKHEYAYKNHMRKHNEDRGPYICNLCSQRFRTFRQLRGHESLHALRLTCYACQRQLRDRARLAEHLAWHAGQTYTCSVCSAIFVRKTTFYNHMRLKHYQKKFKCEFCPKVFDAKERIKEHELHHLPTRCHCCDICGKAFYTAANLSSHRMTHVSSREHYCVECDLHFKSATILKNHLTKSSKHRDPSLLRYPCQQCSKRFESELALSRHMDSAHFVNKRLECDKCPARYATRQGLNFHRRSSHEGFVLPRSHKCITCEKSFSSKGLLINHMRTHTGERPFECSQCKKKFTQKSAMRTHVNLVHLKLKRVKKKSKKVVKAEPNTADSIEQKVNLNEDAAIKVSLGTEWCQSVDNLESQKTLNKEHECIDISHNLIDETRSVFFGATQDEEVRFASKQFIID